MSTILEQEARLFILQQLAEERDAVAKLGLI